MTIQNNKTHRAIATLKLPRNVPALITYAVGIVNAMTANAYFTTPSPTLIVLQKAIDDLQTAETAAQKRGQGAAALRNEKKATVVTLLEEERAYVQTTADTNPENGPSIIQSAGMAIRKAPIRVPRGFHAKPGAVSGTLKVYAPSAARRASYDWEYSTDGGKTWIALPSTLQARMSLSGLTALSTLQFRYRAVTKAGVGDWSQPISQLVM